MELFRLPEDGWYNIAIAGEFPHAESGTVQVLDEDGMRSMAGEIHGCAADAAWPGILVDFDHQSLDTDKPSTAAGWIVDAEYRPTGLWAKIRWTSKGREALEGGTFRFISPVWAVADCEELGDKRLRPRHLMNCAVTNCPNIRGMVPLSNREAGEKRLAAPARPLGLAPARPVWVGLANRRRLAEGLGMLANAFMTDEQRKAYWAARTAKTGKGTPTVSYDVDPNLAASNAAANVTATASGAEDRSGHYSPEQLSEVASRYELGIDYNGRAGDWRSSVAARIKDLEYQRDSLEALKLRSPDPFIKGRLNLQDVRREAMKLGLNVIDEVNAAKAHNSVYADYLRRKFRIKKEYHGKAGLDAALNRLEREWNEERIKEARFVEQHNNRLNIRIEDINTQIGKLTHDERSRIEKVNMDADAAAAKAEAKAEKAAERAEKQREQAAKRAENAAKKAEAEAAAATAQAEAEAAKAAARAQAAADRAAAKAAEAERKQREYAQSSAGLRNYYDFVRAGNFAAAEKLQPGVDHAATKNLLDKLTSSPGFTSQNAGFQQQLLRQIEHTNPSEVVSMHASTLTALQELHDKYSQPLKNAMSDEQRKAMFARLGGGGGGARGGGYKPPKTSWWDKTKAFLDGFVEGAQEGAENQVNALAFGLTDKYGITHSYENTGLANEISKGLATIGAFAAYSAMGAAAMGGGIGLGSAAGLGETGIAEIGAKAGQEALREFDNGRSMLEDFSRAIDNLTLPWTGESGPALGGDLSDFMSEIFANPGIRSEFEYMTP